MSGAPGQVYGRGVGQARTVRFPPRLEWASPFVLIFTQLAARAFGRLVDRACVRVYGF